MVSLTGGGLLARRRGKGCQLRRGPARVTQSTSLGQGFMALRKAAPWMDWFTLLCASFPGSYASRAQGHGQSVHRLRLRLSILTPIFKQSRWESSRSLEWAGDRECCLQLAAVHLDSWLGSSQRPGFQRFPLGLHLGTVWWAASPYILWPLDRAAGA